MPYKSIQSIAVGLVVSMLFLTGCGKKTDGKTAQPAAPVAQAGPAKNEPLLHEINLADTLRSLETQSRSFTNATTTLQREESAKQAAAIAERLFNNTQATFGMSIRDVRASGNAAVILRFGQADSNAIPPKLQDILVIQPGQPIELTVSMTHEAASKIQAGQIAIVSTRLIFRPRQSGSMVGTALTAATSHNLLGTLALRSRTAPMPTTIGDLYLADIHGHF